MIWLPIGLRMVFVGVFKEFVWFEGANLYKNSEKT